MRHIADKIKLENDTTPEIEDIFLQKIMQTSPEQRFIMGSRMFDAARTMICASFENELDHLAFKKRLFERLYGDDPCFEIFSVLMK